MLSSGTGGFNPGKSLQLGVAWRLGQPSAGLCGMAKKNKVKPCRFSDRPSRSLATIPTEQSYTEMYIYDAALYI